MSAHAGLPKLRRLDMIRYAISDRSLFTGSERDRRQALLRQAEVLADEGVDYFQLREKDLEAEDLLQLATSLRQGVAHTSMRVVLNGPRALAERAGVAWHRTSTETDRSPALSASCHSLADVVAARGVTDLLLFGPVFEKITAGQQGVGLGALRAAVQTAAPVPVLALGGVAIHDADECLQAGAAGLAAIRMFLR